jgi:hypothetical protein
VYQFAVPNIVGGFVRVLNKPGQYLHMAEVEVFGVAAAPVAIAPLPSPAPAPTGGTPGNIALKKPATQSSDVTAQWPGGTPDKAVDGNTNPNWNFSNGALVSLQHTNNGPNEFWMVNLQGNFAIAGIKITNRADCCTDRIVGATVQVLDNAGQVKWSAPVTAVAPVYQFAVPNIVGGFVRVLNKPGQYLHMAEVEVFGVPAGAVAVSTPNAPTAAVVR